MNATDPVNPTPTAEEIAEMDARGNPARIDLPGGWYFVQVNPPHGVIYALRTPKGRGFGINGTGMSMGLAPVRAFAASLARSAASGGESFKLPSSDRVDLSGGCAIAFRKGPNGDRWADFVLPDGRTAARTAECNGRDFATALARGASSGNEDVATLVDALEQTVWDSAVARIASDDNAEEEAERKTARIALMNAITQGATTPWGTFDRDLGLVSAIPTTIMDAFRQRAAARVPPEVRESFVAACGAAWLGGRQSVASGDTVAAIAKVVSAAWELLETAEGTPSDVAIDPKRWLALSEAYARLRAMRAGEPINGASLAREVLTGAVDDGQRKAAHVFR